jgi:hypothetical protein
MEKSLTELATIYENLEFHKSFPDSFDPQIEKVKAQVKLDMHAIETCLSGVITYYNTLKAKAEAMPADIGNVNELSKLKSLIVQQLSWASQFK